ncbi:MAG: hypothetical protein WCF85_17275, partial [Rhodospirillaceae bacterium]
RRISRQPKQVKPECFGIAGTRRIKQDSGAAEGFRRRLKGGDAVKKFFGWCCYLKVKIEIRLTIILDKTGR